VKVIATVSVSHPSVDVGTLVSILPRAFDSVRSAVGAGIAETGPDGMTIGAPGVDALIKVHFKLTYEEPERTVADMVAEAADVSG
jgi:hypothetical protein